MERYGSTDVSLHLQEVAACSYDQWYYLFGGDNKSKYSIDNNDNNSDNYDNTDTSSGVDVRVWKSEFIELEESFVKFLLGDQIFVRNKNKNENENSYAQGIDKNENKNGIEAVDKGNEGEANISTPIFPQEMIMNGEEDCNIYDAYHTNNNSNEISQRESDSDSNSDSDDECVEYLDSFPALISWLEGAISRLNPNTNSNNNNEKRDS